MTKSRAFTLIEVMIALALSSIIIFGMMQTYNNVINYLNHVRATLNFTRKACLLFNQLERDFSTAFIPPLLEPIKSQKDEVSQNLQEREVDDKNKKQNEVRNPQKNVADKQKIETQKKEKLKIYFVALNNDGERPKRINEHRCYPFKSVSFINTNPLQVYGQKRVRVVRVLYELVVDKAQSKGDIVSYKLYRKEVEDLENIKAKEDELESVKDRKKVVRVHLVADGIKDLFFQYIYRGYKKHEVKKTDEKPEVEELYFDTWGSDKKETFGIVPCQVNVWISFWDEKHSKSVSLQTLFPIFSFSLVDEFDKEKKGSEENNVAPQKSDEINEEQLQQQSRAQHFQEGSQRISQQPLLQTVTDGDAKSLLNF